MEISKEMLVVTSPDQGEMMLRARFRWCSWIDLNEYWNVPVSWTGAVGPCALLTVGSLFSALWNGEFWLENKERSVLPLFSFYDRHGSLWTFPEPLPSALITPRECGCGSAELRVAKCHPGTWGARTQASTRLPLLDRGSLNRFLFLYHGLVMIKIHSREKLTR